MTREEAIKNIKEHCYFANLIPQAKEALDMAIKALKQEPCDKCVYSTSEGCQYDDITETIPPFEPCEDAISRQAVINHICEGKDCYKENCKGVLFNRCPDITWVNELPPFNPQKPICPSAGVDCEDCPAYEDAISRKAVTDALCSDCELYKDGKRTCFMKCEEYHFLTTLPPVVTKEERALLQKWRYSRGVSIEEFEEAMYAMSSSKNLNKWIPLKTRPMTDEESTFYRDWAEYGAELFDCPLPDDGQEVLVSWGGNVCIDTFVRDDRDGCYFEGVDIGDVEAWQPLPKPYEPQERRKNDT